jgi:hypothetical protein
MNREIKLLILRNMRNGLSVGSIQRKIIEKKMAELLKNRV